jgi:hypothetical protein
VIHSSASQLFLQRSSIGDRVFKTQGLVIKASLKDPAAQDSL